MAPFIKPEFYITHDAHDILTDADYQFGPLGRQCLIALKGMMVMAEHEVEHAPILKRFSSQQFGGDCPFCLATFWHEENGVRIVMTKGFHFIASFAGMPDLLPLPREWLLYHLDCSA